MRAFDEPTTDDTPPQGGDGSRQPSKMELELAETQGREFYKLAAQHFK